MDRREFLKAACGVTLAGSVGLREIALAEADWPRGDRPPNILLVLVDDLGYGDTSCYGGEGPPTPGIDRLAAEGALFTDAYASSPVCSATRAGLLTGRYQERFGHYTNRSDEVGLPLNEVTLAEVLQGAGYATSMVGKWHLGFRPGTRPLERGFQEFYGFFGRGHDYFKMRRDGWSPMYRGEEAIDDTGYLTENFTREAVSFIERQADRPFFLHLAYSAVHAPRQAPDRYTDRFTCEDERKRTYLGMLACLDDGIGAILDTLDRLEIGDQTVIFFLSDNGAIGPGSNGPLRGGKDQLWEGGIRVPCIVRWPGKVREGTETALPCISLDVFPTALAAADIPLPRDRTIDGRNLLPTFSSRERPSRPRVLYWSHTQTPEESWAIRWRDWKLVGEGREAALFNVRQDIAETTDLAGSQPVFAERLRTYYRAWRDSMAQPNPQEFKPTKPGRVLGGR